MLVVSVRVQICEATVHGGFGGSVHLIEELTISILELVIRSQPLLDSSEGGRRPHVDGLSLLQKGIADETSS